MIVRQLYGGRLPKAGGVISLVGAGGKTTLMFRMARELAAAGETVLTTTTTRIYRPEAAQSAHVVVADELSAALPALARRLRQSRHVTAAAGCVPEGANSPAIRLKPLMPCAPPGFSAGSWWRPTGPPGGR
jgi:probable selenium-dependent hydroxylase accessory protein YqeC